MIETALVELIDRATVECAEQQRADLHHRLRQIRNRVLDPAQFVLVVGESKQGKSELINAIVNARICNAGDDVTTVVPTVVRYADEPTALLVEQGGSQSPAQRSPALQGGPPTLDRVPVPVEKVREHLDQAVSDGRPVARSEVSIPRGVLKNGLVLMDTPGVGSVTTSLTATTLAAVAEADALLMVSDATQELTTNELNFLREVTALCPNVALVQPKIDITPHWRKIVEVNRKHLTNAGIGGKIFPVSSTVRMQAAHAQNADLNAESGFPPLVEFLRTEMTNQHEQLTRRLVAHNVADALDQITDSLKTELSGHSPRTAAETLLELESAQRRAEDLKRVTSRWQKALSDGIGELYADTEFDLRERCWAVLHQANETLDEADPNLVWEDFADWLQNALHESAEATFQWLNQRREQLCDHVSDHFLREHANLIPHLEQVEPSDPSSLVPDPKAPRGSDYRRVDQVLTGLRGSYGGVLMFGLITSMTGLPLMNVVSISAGLLLGSKSLNEEKDARLKRRQSEARVSAQRYVENVVFQLNKEAKDSIRKTHRILHEHFTSITEDAQGKLSSAILDIKRAAEHSAVERDQRARDIRTKLEELAVLRKRVAMLTTNRIAAA